MMARRAAGIMREAQTLTAVPVTPMAIEYPPCCGDENVNERWTQNA